MKRNNITPAQLTAGQRATLSSLGIPANKQAGVDAKQLLNEADGKTTLDCIVPTTPKPIGAETGSVGTAQTINKVDVYPNPAQNYVNFIYDIPVHNGQLVLKITDVKGALVKTIVLKDNKGQTWWDTRQIANGTYLYQLVDGNKQVQSGKVIIAK